MSTEIHTTPTNGRAARAPAAKPQPRPAGRQMPATIPPLPPPDQSAAYHREYEGGAGVWAEVVWVTPEWAARVLAACNTRNRRPKAASIERVYSAITSGGWRLNGETVVFDTTGRLVDGQNRLHGVVKAGEPVPTLVVFGVQPEGFYSHGQAAPRTRADVLTIPTAENPTGEKNVGTLASAVCWLYRHEQADLSHYNLTPSNDEFVATLNRNPGIRESVTATNGRLTRGVHPPAPFAVLHYLLGQSDNDLRDLFFAQVLDGVDVAANSQAMALNRWLKNRAGATHKSNDVVMLMAVVIKAWNQVRLNRPPTQVLSWRENEGFPTIA